MAVSAVKRDGLNEILAAMASAIQGQPERVPPGWYTVKELAKIKGRSEVVARRAACAAVLAGTLECRKFSIRTGDKIYPVPHYRAKNLRA